jgi:hypothetical protein
MTNEIILTLRGVADKQIATKLGLTIESLQNILNGYADSEFLQTFNLTEETIFTIKNEIGTEGLRGMVISKLIINKK